MYQRTGNQFILFSTVKSQSTFNGAKYNVQYLSQNYENIFGKEEMYRHRPCIYDSLNDMDVFVILLSCIAWWRLIIDHNDHLVCCDISDIIYAFCIYKIIIQSVGPLRFLYRSDFSTPQNSPVLNIRMLFIFRKNWFSAASCCRVPFITWLFGGTCFSSIPLYTVYTSPIWSILHTRTVSTAFHLISTKHVIGQIYIDTNHGISI